MYCNKHKEHFKVKPNSFLNKRTKCPKCGNESLKKHRTMPFSTFVDRANKVHYNNYVYLEESYTKVSSYIDIKCQCCDNIFKQTGSAHLQGQGCPLCGLKKRSISSRHTTPIFIEKSIKVYGDRYSYDFVEYVDDKTPVTITCKEHGNFDKVPSSFLQGIGCPSCSTTGFDQTKPAILYYLKINGGSAYKIGITNRTVNERFNIKDLKNIEVLQTWNMIVVKKLMTKSKRY